MNEKLYIRVTEAGVTIVTKYLSIRLSTELISDKKELKRFLSEGHPQEHVNVLLKLIKNIKYVVAIGN